MKQPLVSIVTPAYQAEKFISDTIKSVIDQTYDHWEYIIVNDGSSDRTESLVDDYMKSENRLQLITIENSGVSVARNTGISACKGEYIAFLDADDVWLPENLERKIEILESDQRVGWVYSDMYDADQDMKVIRVAPSGRDDNILENILLWEGEVVPGPCSNIVVRSDFIQRQIKFDRNLSTAADQDFCIQLAAQGWRAHHIKSPLWKYRILEGSMSKNIGVMESDHIYVFRKAESQSLYRSFLFKRKCFSNLFLILGVNWWVHGNDRKRALLFMVKSFLQYPPVIWKIVLKTLRKV